MFTHHPLEPVVRAYERARAQEADQERLLRAARYRRTCAGQHRYLAHVRLTTRARTRRVLTALTALLVTLVLLGAGLQVVIAHAGRGSVPVYSVDQIHAALSERPMAWAGRAVRVRGVLEATVVYCASPAQPCIPSEVFSLVGANGVQGMPIPFLRVSPASPAPAWAALHRIPLIGALAPPLQVVRLDLPSIYRLRLQPAPAGCQPTGSALCYQGVLVDAAWPSP